MNFLAHAYLSGNNAKILVGNFIADFVKGKHALSGFEADIVEGIELHRMIDEYTDSHEIVLQSKKRLRPKYRHYSAVIVDVFYDHLLAKGWANYHRQPLPDFAASVYRTIQSSTAVLPKGVRFMLPYMIRDNWLVNYSKLEGIKRALTGMSQRTPYESKMDEAVTDLKNHYQEFNAEFELFFPMLKNTCDAWLRDHHHHDY